MPHSRAMPSIGARCHELRVVDRDHSFRIVYRTDADAVLVLDVFAKRTRATPDDVIDACKRRARAYDDAGDEQ